MLTASIRIYSAAYSNNLLIEVFVLDLVSSFVKFLAVTAFIASINVSSFVRALLVRFTTVRVWLGERDGLDLLYLFYRPRSSD